MTTVYIVSHFFIVSIREYLNVFGVKRTDLVRLLCRLKISSVHLDRRMHNGARLLHAVTDLVTVRTFILLLVVLTSSLMTQEIGRYP